jgi:hypothetical protein
MSWLDFFKKMKMKMVLMVFLLIGRVCHTRVWPLRDGILPKQEVATRKTQ